MAPLFGHGIFSHLPLEMRNTIWSNVDADLLARSSISRPIRAEMQQVLGSFDLEFLLSGSPTAPHGSEIRVRNQYRSLCSLYPRWLTFESYDDSIDRFLHMPYHKCRSVTFRVPAPGIKRGNLPRLWNSLVWLVEGWNHLPPQCRRQSSLKVVFEDSNESVRSCFALNDRFIGSCSVHAAADIKVLLLPIR